jgi:hypothetical protein
MIVERLLHPCSKVATTRDWHSTTLAEELGVSNATENDLYEALDWLLERKLRIETKLAERHLSDDGLVLYDVSSSYYEGRTCPLVRFGHDRDGEKGLSIIVYGVITDIAGCPIAVDVYPGNTNDKKTVVDQIKKLRQSFGLSRVVLVGDRGMLTQPQIDKIKEQDGWGWITALTSTAHRCCSKTRSYRKNESAVIRFFRQPHRSRRTKKSKHGKPRRDFPCIVSPRCCKHWPAGPACHRSRLSADPRAHAAAGPGLCTARLVASNEQLNFLPSLRK